MKFNIPNWFKREKKDEVIVKLFFDNDFHMEFPVEKFECDSKEPDEALAARVLDSYSNRNYISVMAIERNQKRVYDAYNPYLSKQQ